MNLQSNPNYRPPAPSLAARQVALVSKGHFTGHLIVDDGNLGRVVAVESHLEMIWAIYLLSLPGVKTIMEQAAFEWVDAYGEVRTKYFDFLVVLHDGRRLACEVKPSKRLESGRVVAELRQISAQMTPDFADEVRLLTENGLDQISLYNAEMFMGMRDADPEVDVVALSEVRKLRGTVTMADLTRLIAQGARGFRALVRLIMKQVLRIVGHERIAPATRVSLKEDF